MDSEAKKPHQNVGTLPMSKEFLISRGKCCGLGCKNCPYEPKHVKGNKDIK